jgi:hypothetical protein
MAPPYKVLGWAIFTVICYIVFIGLAIAMRPYSGDHFGLERDLAYNWYGRRRCSALVVSVLFLKNEMPQGAVRSVLAWRGVGNDDKAPGRSAPRAERNVTIGRPTLAATRVYRSCCWALCARSSWTCGWAGSSATW